MLDKEQLKKQMLDLIEEEKKYFQQLLHTYQEIEDPTDEAYAQLNAELVASLERVKDLYDTHQGQNSLFLKNTLKPLLEALDAAKKVRQAMALGDDIEANPDTPFEALSDETMRVYVVLYQADGANIAKWVVQLLSVHKLLASRPVYLDESEARQACRVGLELMAKGYISIVVKKTMLIEDEHTAKRADKHGRSLLLLKDTAIEDGGKIEYLVLGKTRYRWYNDQLLPMQLI